MTTSNYMPSVVVEIAFDSGYSTAAGSRTWTDVSSYVELAEGITIGYGRADELTVADANSLSLTLDNSDGRFTPGKTGGAYYPNVKIGRPIRVTATPVGGVASVRFLGYVDEWPVEWDGTDAYASASITARSRIARLGFDAELESLLAEEYLAASPDVYYPLSEPADSTSASDVSTNAQPPLTIYGTGSPPVFGSATGPGTDGATAVTFPATLGKQLRCGSLAAVGSTGGVYAECFFLAASAPSPNVFSLIAFYTPVDVVTDVPGLNIFLTTAGKVAVVLVDAATPYTVTSSTTVCDGATHHVAAIYSGTTLGLYVDGVADGSTLIPAGLSTGYRTIKLGTPALGTAPGVAVVMAHAAAGDAMTAADALRHADAGRTGFAGETASARIVRYAGYTSIPSAEVAADAGTNPVDTYNTTGHTAIDAMRAIEESEGGVLHDARDNTLIFKGRAARYTVASSFSLDAALQQIEVDITPKLDRTAMANDYTVTASDGTTARAINPQSITDYGYVRPSGGNVLASNDVALQAASWRVNTYGEPQPRIPALGVNLLPLAGALQANIFAADIGTRFTALNLPVQAPAASLDTFIEGYTENIGFESYRFVFNVSPTLGFDVWTLDDPVFGEYDAYPISY